MLEAFISASVYVYILHSLINLKYVLNDCIFTYHIVNIKL